MLTVVVRTGLLPQQVDDFPEGCKRSCRGSIHLKPGTVLVTDGELEHIRKSRPELSAYLQVVDRTRPAKPLGDDSGADPVEATEVVPDPTEAVTGASVPADETLPKRRKRRGFSDAH